MEKRRISSEEEVSTTDQIGLSGRRSAGLYVTNITKIHSDHGIDYFDHRADSTGAPIDLTEPFLLRYMGFPIDTILLEPTSDMLEVRETDGAIEVIAIGDGTSEPVRIVVKSDRGIEFRSPAFTFTRDNEAPTLNIDSSSLSGRIGGPVTISGFASDNLGVVSAYYDLN